MTDLISVVIPVRDGALVLESTLAAVRAQELTPTASVELLVCDSGSRDDTIAVARSYGAEVIEIAPASFSHGLTRNLLMQRSAGEHVAFLTQDSEPADARWLARLLEGFSLGEDVALTYGPYRARPHASQMVARELSEWFGSFSPDGRPRVDRLSPAERTVPARALLGPRGFYTDANGCVARAAWDEVPFRDVPYAEDHVLAIDMMRAGFAKVFLPEAAVIHSHDYSTWQWLKRSFDEGRGLHQVYGFVEPRDPRRATLKIWGLAGADWRWCRKHARGSARPRGVTRSVAVHTARTLGSILGGRAEQLPDAVVRRLSLERRGTRRDRGCE
jgi:glycosyltransferase involved in cell wall biosynthesis